MHLYKFDVPLATGPLPRSFSRFLIYVWRKNPVLWLCIALSDIVHYTRFPIAFVFMGHIIDILGNSDPANGIPLSVQKMLAIIFVVLTVGESAHIWLTQIYIHWQPKLRLAIRSDYFRYALSHSHSYFQDHFAGSLARKVSELAEGMLRLLEIFRNQLGFSVISMTVSFIIACTINGIYATFLMGFILSIIIPVFFRLNYIRARSRKFSDQRSLMTGIIVDSITNMPAVKSFSGGVYENDYHDSESEREARRAAKLRRTSAQIENVRRLSLIILGGGMASLCCYGWSQGWITVGQASTLSTLAFTLAGSTWMLGMGIVALADEIGNLTESLHTIAIPHQIEDKPGAARINVASGHVKYSHVRFSYGERTIFNDMDIDIHPGERIALIGPSGAGKTSFVNLLLRLYDINDGKILIDGQDISQVTQNSLRQNIAVIPQDTALFHRSLMENIRYGRRDATDAEVIEAAKRAHAHEFISALSEGYNTLVGERGIKLSGGQRQRIAIARAILKNAPILVLDEATSALDSESERLIQQALDELMKGKTVIAIAHRLSTIARMDRILVFDNGEIVEQGNHQHLLDKRGLYARLWAMQSGGFLHEDGPDTTSEAKQMTENTLDD